VTYRQIAIVMQEWESATPASHSQLAGASIEGSPEVESLVQVLSQSGMLEILELKHGLSVGATSFVGQVQVGNLTVTVLPKLKSQSLVNLLRYAYGLGNLTCFSQTLQKLDRRAFQDLLISELLVQVQELVSRGLHRTYVRKEGDLASPRGKISIQRFVTQGSRLTACLPCIHHPRTEDCLLNQVVTAGLALAAALATDTVLKRESRRLATIVETSLTPIRLDERILNRAEQSLNRLTTAYAPALSIIRLLLDSLGVTLTGTAATQPLPGFLFDMNRFFQSLLSRFLRENLPDHSVRDEYRLRGVIQYDPDYNPKKRCSPTPRPDFVVLEGNAVIAILDAKYRDLWEKALPREMLYQLAIYAVLHDVHAATILYPSLDPLAQPARLNLNDSLRGEMVAHVWLRPVQLDVIEKLVMSGDSAQIRRQRWAYAEQLVFGEAKQPAPRT
jgi:5-methylcytosine-specific restriction enzyme subunit McrC